MITPTNLCETSTGASVVAAGDVLCTSAESAFASMSVAPPATHSRSQGIGKGKNPPKPGGGAKRRHTGEKPPAESFHATTSVGQNPVKTSQGRNHMVTSF